MNQFIHHKFTYWLTRIYVSLYVRVKNYFGHSWYSVNDIWLPLYPEIGFNTLRWIINKSYEVSEINIIKQKLAKSDRVLEIGTGLGFVSTFCAKVVGSENVFSFEANPYNFNIARLVYQKNKVAPQLHNAILSNNDGHFDFPIDQKSLLASSLLKKSANVLTVKQKNLNHVIQDIQPNFLIMDIEGSEYDIFKIINFQSIQKIQVEMHLEILGKVKVAEILSILHENGFIKEVISPDGTTYYFSRQTN